MKYISFLLAAISFFLCCMKLHSQVIEDYERDMTELNVSDRSDHIFTDFIISYPKAADAAWKKTFQNEVMTRVADFFAEDSPEMEICFASSDSLEYALKDLSKKLVEKTERLTAADTTLWQRDFKGERYYFNFGIQVEAIPLEGTDIFSFHFMVSEFKPWGTTEKNLEGWCCYDMKNNRKLGLSDFIQPEGFPALREAIEQFATMFYLGEDGRKLLVRNCDREIPLPAEYDVALVSGALRYSYPKDALIRGGAMSGVVPVEMIKDYLTPMAKTAIGL